LVHDDQQTERHQESRNRGQEAHIFFVSTDRAWRRAPSSRSRIASTEFGGAPRLATSTSWITAGIRANGSSRFKKESTATSLAAFRAMQRSEEHTSELQSP